MYLTNAGNIGPFVAQEMRGFGYYDSRVVASQHFGRVDIVSSRARAVALFVAHDIGATTLREIEESNSTDPRGELWCFSATNFDNSAQGYADKHSITLIQYTLHGGLIPVNNLAAKKTWLLAELPIEEFEWR